MGKYTNRKCSAGDCHTCLAFSRVMISAYVTLNRGYGRQLGRFAEIQRRYSSHRVHRELLKLDTVTCVFQVIPVSVSTVTDLSY